METRGWLQDQAWVLVLEEMKLVLDMTSLIHRASRVVESWGSKYYLK